jgi:hypothetical protein
MTSDLRPQKRTPQPSESGMGRFFSPRNLDRYRQLASGILGDADQHKLLMALSGEMEAFRHEARTNFVRTFKQDTDLKPKISHDTIRQGREDGPPAANHSDNS